MATVFVTVGTTSFNELVEAASSKSFRGLLYAKGYRKLILQIGRGELTPQEDASSGEVALSYYRYKDTLADDIRQADLVISHAGAGCILETLDAEKPLVVVVNETLMGNHQLELARQLHRDGHIQYCVPRDLSAVVDALDPASLRLLPHGQPRLFGEWLTKTANEPSDYQSGVVKVRRVLFAVIVAIVALLLYAFR
eukprot:scpid90487/ scgid11357/ UDP-N-acetylglucosamine transferase subunit ALG13 homolog; Glycosyltransferase 28 domain-containing protein 1